MRTDIFLSNHLEVLLEHLKKNLFPLGSSPFCKRIVITPSSAMQEWVRLRLAEELGVAAGITFVSLSQALQLLAPNSPSLQEVELTLAIDSKLFESNEEAVKSYIASDPKRRFSLAKHLSTLFKRYSIYASTLSGEGWQERLWSELFSEQSLLEEARQHSQVHLFCFSHLPPLYFQFFQKVGATLYSLSPCMEFWSDLTSEKHALREGLEVGHPLLANLGKVGRQMAFQIEESQADIHEEYVESACESTLGQLQCDLLHLQKSALSCDDSISFMRCSDRRLEIKHLFAKLAPLLQSYEPHEILVMAPHIEPYLPFIRLYFDKVPILVEDLDPHKEEGLLRGLDLLISTFNKRFSAPHLLELFAHPLFKMDDVETIEKWVLKHHIRWGIDAKQQAQILDSYVERECSTWNQGIASLMQELAYEQLPFTQAPLLGELILTLEALKSDVEKFHVEHTLRYWCDFFLELIDRYFSATAEQKEPIFASLAPVQRAAQHFSDELYTFEMFFSLLQFPSKSLYSNQIQAVRFCSLQPMRAIPAKVICLIGMNFENFPRMEKVQGLDLLRGKTFYPTSADFDRYLFLETLISARERLLLSYIYKETDGSELPPSIVLEELHSLVGKPEIETFCPKHRSTKKQTHRIFPQLFENQTIPEQIEPLAATLDVSELLRLARSPLAHFLGHSVFDRDIVQAEEEFVLPKYKLQSGDVSEKEMPPGQFYELTQQKTAPQHASEIKELVPPLVVGNQHLVGSFEKVEGRLNFKESVACWPLLLLAEERYAELSEYLAYFHLAKEFPSPLLPTWTEAIVKGDPIRLEKMMLASTNKTALWAFQSGFPPPQLLIEMWQPWAQKLFGGLV